MTPHLLYVSFFLFFYFFYFYFLREGCGGGGEGGVITGFKIVATIVGNSRGTLNTILRQTLKFLEIYTQLSVNGLWAWAVLPSTVNCKGNSHASYV